MKPLWPLISIVLGGGPGEFDVGLLASDGRAAVPVERRDLSGAVGAGIPFAGRRVVHGLGQACESGDPDDVLNDAPQDSKNGPAAAVGVLSGSSPVPPPSSPEQPASSAADNATTATRKLDRIRVCRGHDAHVWWVCRLRDHAAGHWRRFLAAVGADCCRYSIRPSAPTRAC